MHRPIVLGAFAALCGSGLYWADSLSRGIACITLTYALFRLFRLSTSAAAAAAVFVVLGWTWTWIRMHPAPNDASIWTGRHVTVVGQVLDISSAGTNRRARLGVEVIEADGVHHNASGQLLVYLPRNAPALEHGSAVRIRGSIQKPMGPRYEGAFDPGNYLSRHGIFAVMKAASGRAVSVIQGSYNPLLSARAAAARTASSFQSAMRSLFPPRHAAFLCGLVLGAGADLPEDIRNDFVRTGTAHVLAASGANVLIFVQLWGLLAVRTPLPLWIRHAAAIAVCWGYAMCAGLDPSVVRAALMITIVQVGRLAQREPDVLSSIAAAAGLLFLFDPGAVCDAGFQLSFVLVLALCMGGDAGMRWAMQNSGSRSSEGSFVTSLRELWAATCLAQTASAPLTAAHFQQVSIAGYVANPLLLSFIEGLMPVALLLWPITLLIPSVAEPIAWVVDLLLTLLLSFVHHMASVPFAQIETGPVPPAAVLSILCAMAWLGIQSARRRELT
jgi:competence protein ComEC